MGDVEDIYHGKEDGNYYVASRLGSTCKSSYLQVASYLVIGGKTTSLFVLGVTAGLRVQTSGLDTLYWV